ncbi:macrophage mannose receptor 1-like [Saccoglossus kowalevskii]
MHYPNCISDDVNVVIVACLIRSSSTNHHWIGLREYGIGSGYEWSDGTALDYQNWDAGEPNDFNGEEQCVNFYAHDQGTWNDKNCGERIPFICRKFEHITHPITRIPTTPMPGPCPGGGWMEYGGKCYKIYSGDGSDSLTWEDARTVCRDLGGDLATIHSQALQSFLISKLRYVSSALWIGLSDISYQNRFIWTDGTPVDYTNWAADEPNGYYADDCVEMMYISSHAGQWNDISCDSERGYICQGDKDVDPSAPDPTYPSEDECQDDYIQEYLGCYKVVKSSQTHQSSNDICVNDGGNLVSIIDAYEQGFIDTLVFDVDRPLWIGMAYNEESSEYKWIDGTPVYYTNWGSGEPSGGDDSGCVQSTTDGWDDTNCAELTGAICKIYLAPPPTTPEYVEGHCPATFVSYGSDCYYFGGVNDYKSFSDGQLECIRLGADLASIHHQQENDFVFAYLNSMDVYLGLTRTGNGWKWVDESVLQYTNWAVGEPSDSNGEEDCVVMLHNQGTWNDLVCSGYKGYVCKRPKDGDPVESSTITNNPGDPVMDDPDSNNSDVNVAGIILVCELIIVAIVGIAFLVRWFVKKQCYGGKQGEFMSGPAADFSNSMYEPSVNSTPSTIPSISAMSGSPVGPVYDNPQPVPQYPEDTIYFSVA